MRRLIILFLGFLFFMPFSVLADGMIVTPPEYWAREQDQKAVIFHDQGVETLILSITFQGNADDFGWVVPTPQKPEIRKGSDEVFTNLHQWTGTSSNLKRPVFGLGQTSDEVSSGVTVIETKQIEYYDVTVLSSETKDALITWLNDNGYSFPESASYILNSYIENNWYFVAMRINPQSLEWSNVAEQLRSGHAVPVAISFPAENIVYPMKISSIISESESSDSATYGAGRVGQAIQLSSDQTLTFPASGAFTSSAGTIEAWVKPDSSWAAGGGYWEILNVVDSYESDVFEFRRAEQYGTTTQDGLQFIAYAENGETQAWSMALDQPFIWDPNTWYHLAVTWSLDHQPVTYINGQSYAMTPAYGATTWSPRSFSGGTVYVGQRGNYLGDSGLRASIDELSIRDSYASPADILASYQAGLAGTTPVVGVDTLLLGHFDSSLEDTVSGSAFTFINGATLSIRDRMSDAVNVTLYVLSDGRKTLPNFNTSYANWISKTKIEQLGVDDQGNPLLAPTAKKYFLTKLTATMSPDNMTEDLFLRATPIGATIGDEITTTRIPTISSFYWFIGGVIVLTIGLAVVLMVIGKRREEQHDL